MKTHKHLYPQIASFDNLYLAFKTARKGKRARPDIAEFEFNLEENLLELQSELQSETYQPGKYHNFRINDPKPRLISAAPFRDRVVHHALCGVVEPLFDIRFIYDTYACRKIFETITDREKARTVLLYWIDRVEKLQVTAFQPFLITLRNWFELILNYFLERWTNAFAEGINNKIKLIKRRAFGFTNFDHFRLRILVECAPYPT